MAKAGYEEMAKRKTGLIDSGVPTWENQAEELREEYLALARAIRQTLGDSSMATASGRGEGRRGSVIAIIACAVVLTFLGGFNAALWTERWSSFPSLVGADRASPAMSKAAQIEPDPRRPGIEATIAAGEVATPRPSSDTMAAAPAVEASAPAYTTPPTVEPREASASRSPAPRPLTFAEVREVQRQLRAVGFNPGPLDGSAGPTTTNAARQYQRARGLAVTGQIDHDLLARLREERTAAPPRRGDATATNPPPPRQGNDFFDGIDRMFRRL
jgi:hypothetical protein